MSISTRTSRQMNVISNLENAVIKLECALSGLVKERRDETDFHRGNDTYLKHLLEYAEALNNATREYASAETKVPKLSYEEVKEKLKERKR